MKIEKKLKKKTCKPLSDEHIQCIVDDIQVIFGVDLKESEFFDEGFKLFSAVMKDRYRTGYFFGGN